MSNLGDLGIDVIMALKRRQETLSVSESSCGGLISASLVALPGASAYYVGGAVIYTRAAQKALLQISDVQMSDIRASSEPYALLNARAIRNSVGTTWALSETGASGPEGNRYGDSAGHACLAVAGPVESIITLETKDSDRVSNMWVFAKAGFGLLHKCIMEST